MLKLTVVNDCLASMGETPLNAITDPHTYRGAALSKLDAANTEIQSRTWWFNRETMTIAPSPIDGRIYLPGDVIEVITAVTAYVQRGNILYDAANGTDVFTSSVTMTIVRLLPFEQVPAVVAAYIAAKAVLVFQTEYDGDVAKARDLAKLMSEAQAYANAANIRNTAANLIDSNDRLMFIKQRFWQGRNSRRP